MNRASNILLALAILSYIIVIGGATYEHIAVVPQWTAAPPVSLSMIQGDYGLKQEHFWMSIHPVTLLLMIAALVANWRTQRRSTIGIVFGGYFLVLVITRIYFVPELLDIMGTPFSTAVDTGLQARAGLWEVLSLVRLAFLIGVALKFLSALTIPATALRSTAPEPQSGASGHVRREIECEGARVQGIRSSRPRTFSPSHPRTLPPLHPLTLSPSLS
jgi:hypothetical protein